MSKVTKDQYIKDLEHDMDMLGSMVTELREENTGLRKQLRDLVERVPSTYLTDSAKFSGETHPDAKHKSWDEIKDKTYIYESPDKGKTVYRREFGDYDTPREQVDSDGNPLPTQMKLF